MNDCSSITGSNIKRILALTKKSKVEEITAADIEKIVYAEIPEGNKWRVELIKEITDIKFGQLELNGFTKEECEEMLKFACVS